MGSNPVWIADHKKKKKGQGEALKLNSEYFIWLLIKLIIAFQDLNALSIFFLLTSP